MKTIGLLGGMSWESSLIYYQLINELVNQRKGGLHSAKSLMYSVDFEEIERYQNQGKWEEAAQVLVEAAKNLERGGADFLVLCTNTMHKVANEIEKTLTIPMLHIADATAEVIISQGIKRVGLLGTKYTLEENFYKQRLIENYALEVVIPKKPDIELINRIIFEELVFGKINAESKNHFLRIMYELVNKGAEGIILGCTEIGLLIKQEDISTPLFDTTYLHALKAIGFALSK
ncbi:aspartate racemase [Vulcanibacillus modesticaldus]|uniref:Aspartate racemase n=1 Tax=Vulcanibacillus modesticaldus TaxID=337097 RepID=A0A1D2YX12_9BACI|nr:aspartate/glutamate racemase family protein [Vulcanibacillus modesticaldus]OEG00157.1 aspartate racemase [Vulcanibacillus modesticaldus]